MSIEAVDLHRLLHQQQSAGASSAAHCSVSCLLPCSPTGHLCCSCAHKRNNPALQAHVPDITCRTPLQEVGQKVRAARKEDEIPLNPFTAGVYIATMMATVQVLREKVCRRVTSQGSHNMHLLRRASKSGTAQSEQALPQSEPAQEFSHAKRVPGRRLQHRGIACRRHVLC